MPRVVPFQEDDDQLRRPRRLRTIMILPTLFTLGNLLCGFSAIHFAMRYLAPGGDQPFAADLLTHLDERTLPSFLALGAGLVIAGMVFDAFDGLIARATRSTTNFGGQLDSLADIVTCGVAPAILMIAFMTEELAADRITPSPLSSHPLGRVAWACAAVYVAFAAIRLARFNVEHASATADHRVFRGLPSPGAAAVIAAAIILLQEPLGAPARQFMVYALPFVALAVAGLMVSNVPYRRVHRVYLLGRRPIHQVLFVIVLAAVFLSYKAPTLLLAALWYAASGPFDMLLRGLRRQGHHTTATADDQDHGNPPQALPG